MFRCAVFLYASPYLCDTAMGGAHTDETLQLLLFLFFSVFFLFLFCFSLLVTVKRLLYGTMKTCGALGRAQGLGHGPIRCVLTLGWIIGTSSHENVI